MADCISIIVPDATDLTKRRRALGYIKYEKTTGPNDLGEPLRSTPTWGLAAWIHVQTSWQPCRVLRGRTQTGCVGNVPKWLQSESRYIQYILYQIYQLMCVDGGKWLRQIDGSRGRWYRVLTRTGRWRDPRSWRSYHRTLMWVGFRLATRQSSGQTTMPLGGLKT